MRNKYLIQNWVFIIGLILLTLNDHYLKSVYHNYTTGKLSDFSGLLILPLFLTYVFPRVANTAAMLSGIFFIFWKSPFSEPLIEVYNTFALIPIYRVVDYSDLIALSILPFSHFFILKISNYKLLYFQTAKIVPMTLVVLSSLVFMATSRTPLYFQKACMRRTEFRLGIGKKYQVRGNYDQVIEYLKNEKYNPSQDTMLRNNVDCDGGIAFLRMDNVKFKRDSVKTIYFRLSKSRFSTSLFSLDAVDSYQNYSEKERSKNTKRCKKMIENEIIEPLQEAMKKIETKY
jgi:hypothetical protein